jgi:hypothetical protein
MITSLALAVVLAAVPQENAAAYKFVKNEVQVYEVKGELAVSLKGSHKDLLEKGDDAPLRMTYAAEFENVVLAADANRVASLARRVRTLKAEGRFRKQPFRVEYDLSRPEDRRFAAAEGHSDLVRFFSLWCTQPQELKVDEVGNVVMPHDELNRLIVKAGIMYWPAKPDQAAWVSRERMAVPLLHHKIKLDFHNAYKRTETRGDRRIMIVEAKPTIAGTEPPDEGAPKEIADAEPEFKASGSATTEIDLTRGRMTLLKLNVRIEISGHAQVSDGSKGDLRGEAVFTETHRLK